MEKSVWYDDTLHIEVYRFQEVTQPFPNHFHDYYVIGLIESGVRSLQCMDRQYTVGPRNVLLFNPGDSHGCTQQDGGTLNYISLNIPEDMMTVLSERRFRVSENVIEDEEISRGIREVFCRIAEKSAELEREEALLLLIQSLEERYGVPYMQTSPDCRQEIEATCVYMQERFSEHITLEQLCRCSGLSKAALIRAFTKAKGVTPYRYLQMIRIGKAKELLERGASTSEVAMETGFADQSHFSNYFNMFIGLPPAAYRNIFKQ